MNVSFGGLMAKARGNKRLTLRRLSPLVGISPSFLSDLEKGRRQPPKSLDKLRALADVLEIPLDQLKEVAERERSTRKNPDFIKKLFTTNQELAWGLCRAADNADSEELERAFQTALDMLENKEE